MFINVDREELLNVLKKRIIEIKFEKTNGDQRIMQCTLREDEIPETEIKVRKRKPNKNTLAAWDLDKKGWRSFRLDKIIYWETI